MSTISPPRLPVLLMAVAAGTVVADLYYLQPLLDTVARDLHVPASRVGVGVTTTQLGYAAALLLIVPLTDLVERRRLIVGLTLAAAVVLALVGAAPALPLLLAGSFALGVASVVPQVLVPVAAALAPPAERGRTVGAIMTGLLLGILLGRTVAGVVAALAGWRAVYLGAAAVVALLALSLRTRLPESRAVPGGATGAGGYGAVLRSLPRWFAEQPVLRSAGLTGALAFASFSAFWTGLTLYLAGPAFGFDSARIGLFGLAGAAGAAAASFVGRLTDRVRPVRLVPLGLLTGIAGLALALWARTDVPALVLGVLLFDVGVQGTHLANQARIFAIGTGTHGRMNGVYMVLYFIGGALGSWACTAVWPRWGWAGVLGLGIGLHVVALGLTLAAPDRRPGRPAAGT
jgi:predicted MFS family arabinose efflux permease